MYINNINISNFRTFRNAKIDFIHPDQDFQKLGFSTPKLKNINLLLANNGLGKTTMLKAIALAALGPAVRNSGIKPFRLVRREAGEDFDKRMLRGRRIRYNLEARIDAEFTPHFQDHVGLHKKIKSLITITRNEDHEVLKWAHRDEKLWYPIFNPMSDAFFVVGYGSNRRVEKGKKDIVNKNQTIEQQRAKRVQSLFEETYTFLPLISWLPTFKNKNPGRYTQVILLINKLMGIGEINFSGEIQDYEYIFERKGMKIPFQALSDGYRAFLGWVGDLLYHICMTAPSGNKLTENKGIVMVDEIDLHLHPKWQMAMLGTLAAELPNIQFIVTSHSPLVVGSLEWMNIIVMEPHNDYSTSPMRIDSAVSGLSADQILISDYFGLESTRAPGKQSKLKELALKAYGGNLEAATQILFEMSTGMEKAPLDTRRYEKSLVKRNVPHLMVGSEIEVPTGRTVSASQTKENVFASGTARKIKKTTKSFIGLEAKKKTSAKKRSELKGSSRRKLK